MEDTLISILETLKYPVIRQGSLPPDQAYPATFITFWNSTEDGQSFYDNETAAVTYQYNVNVYSSNPDTAYSVLESARAALKSAGWIITQRGYDAASDEITHIGRGLQTAYVQYPEIY